MRGFPLVVCLVGCGGTETPPADAPFDAPTAPFEFTVQTTGSPRFRLANPFLFTAPIGAQFENENELLKLMPNHRFDDIAMQFVSATPHPPPYDEEEVDALPSSGLLTGNVFSLADWTPPKAIGLAVMVLPLDDAPDDVTADGTVPVIPNSEYPLGSSATLEREVDGQRTVVDDEFTSELPAASIISADHVGYSHQNFFYLENSSFLQDPDRKGTYYWTVNLQTPGSGGKIELSAGPMYVVP